MHSAGTKLAALLLKGQLGDFKKMLDANEVGGTALLGISKPVVKAHGSEITAENRKGGGAVFRFALERGGEDDGQ